MQRLFQILHDAICSGEDAVLVTIVASSGSTPRGSGARMVVTGRGRIAGTIGGGAVEYESIRRAMTCLEQKSSAGEHFRLSRNEVADIGMICGGEVDVYFCFIAGHDKYMEKLTEEIDRLFEKGIQAWLVTRTDPDAEGRKAASAAENAKVKRKREYSAAENGAKEVGVGISTVTKDGVISGKPLPDRVIRSLGNKPVQVECEQGLFYCEKLVQAGKVYIFGGGHVAQQLVPVLSRCDFSCEVVEDRQEFARPELFEGVKATHLVSGEELEGFAAGITEDDYVCVMTRGHRDDYLVQKAVLKTKACYIGVIGSRFKIAGVNAKLAADGFSQADIDRITTPIGLDIGSETPAEIAVSIAAQLIMVRAERNGKGL